MTSEEDVEGLRWLVANSGVNKNDTAEVFIVACLGGGRTTRQHIVSLAERVGLNRQHVALKLRKGAGESATRHRWKCLSGDHYELH